jgi:hypothetical protein
MNKSYFLFYYLLAAGLSARQSCIAQVSLAPTSLFIHDQSNVASLYINNTSEETQEISIACEFSYPGSDEQGNMINVTDDTLSESKYGLKDNLRVFPRQFVLKPGSQQTVRVQVRPLMGKPDGTYWTRIVVSSNAASKDVESLPVTEAIGTKINYVFKQNIPAFYLKGKTNTGIIPGEVTTSVADGKLVALASLKPTGNSPFNGTVTARLTDNSGKEVAVQQQSVVAYFEVLRRIEIALPPEGLRKGIYKLDFTYETTRADISPADLVQAAPVKKSLEVEIK